jgi:hypothetical protein
MTYNRIATGIVAGCAVVAMSSMPGLAGQGSQKPKPMAMAKTTPESGMAAKCQAMLVDQEQMLTEMKIADERLDALVSKMNGASGTDKADATAAVVTEMVTQRRTMRDGAMKMQHEMMTHMTEHMQAGKDSMAMCPMMKQMKPMKDMKH